MLTQIFYIRWLLSCKSLTQYDNLFYVCNTKDNINKSSQSQKIETAGITVEIPSLIKRHFQIERYYISVISAFYLIWYEIHELLKIVEQNYGEQCSSGYFEILQ